MTIKECIDLVDNVKPNQYGIEEKVEWLSYLDGTIINDVLKTHEGYDGRYDEFIGYSPDNLSTKLIVDSPYNRLYIAYLKMKIDENNGETLRYNNSASMFNSYLLEYKKYYNKTHMPLSNTNGSKPAQPKKPQSEIPGTQIENLKRELLAQLRKDISDSVSEDKIHDVIIEYVAIHRDEFKGKDGADGRDGADGKDGATGKTGANGKDGKDGEKGADGKSAYQYAKEAGYVGSESEFSADLVKDAPSVSEFQNLAKEIADLKYVAIDITKMSCSVGTREIGSAVKECTISWEVNKQPSSQTLEGDSVDVTARSKKFTGLNITTNKSFVLVVTDERGATDSASTSINFVNGVYYGAMESGSTIDSETILAMTRKLQSSKAITFTVNAGATQKIAFAMPTRYGTPNFNVGGFDGGFSLAGTISFTNASGYTENYDVWMSDNVGLGSTTVKVS